MTEEQFEESWGKYLEAKREVRELLEELEKVALKERDTLHLQHFMGHIGVGLVGYVKCLRETNAHRAGMN